MGGRFVNKQQLMAMALLLLFVFAIWDIYTHGIHVFMPLMEPMVPQMHLEDRNREVDVETHAQESINMDATGITRLSIDNPYGRVLVTGGKDTAIQGSVSMIAYSSQTSQGQAYLQKLKVDGKRKGSDLELAVHPDLSEAKDIRAIRIDYVLTVPEGVELDLVGSDLVKVEQMTGKVKVKNTLGVTEIQNVKNAVQIIQHQKYARVNHINGKLLVHAEESDVIAKDIRGEVEVESNQGIVELSDVQGNVQIQANGGSTKLEGVGGSSIVNSHTGNVTLSRMAGPIKVTNIRSDVRVEQPQQDVHITVEDGNVSVISPENHRVAARAFRGNIRSSYTELRPAQDGQNQILTGTLGQAQYELTIEVKVKGEIEIQ